MSDELLCAAPPVRLETRRLQLRPLEGRDAGAIAGFLADPDVARMLARVPFPYSLEDAKAFVAGRNEGDRVFAISARECGDLIGVIGLKDIGPLNADLGYWLGKPHWDRGLATEAVQRIIDFGFETLRLQRIDASCRVVNGASRRVLSKCGFPFLGPGMLDTVASGRVASEHYAMDRRCWEALRTWGRP